MQTKKTKTIQELINGQIDYMDGFEARQSYLKGTWLDAYGVIPCGYPLILLQNLLNSFYKSLKFNRFKNNVGTPQRLHFGFNF